MSLELVKKQVGKQWLITSPQHPGLHVAHADLAAAEAAVPAALRLLENAQRRVDARKEFEALAARHA